MLITPAVKSPEVVKQVLFLPHGTRSPLLLRPEIRGAKVFFCYAFRRIKFIRHCGYS